MEHSVIDLIIRIKNGYLARKVDIEAPYSVFKESILKKLTELGYVKKYNIEGEIIKKITISLSYTNGVPALTDVKIYSKPGARYYISYKKLKPVIGGFGYSILSTPKGIMTHVEAKKEKVGGELLFNIW